MGGIGRIGSLIVNSARDLLALRPKASADLLSRVGAELNFVAPCVCRGDLLRQHRPKGAKWGGQKRDTQNL